ncbi:restriction endonuclease subunit S [Mariniradius sediminis]|uniref:Restriction endonuclease subunit S n=1 Tax=Mariniradius sediminis TaxID=2909237 RepID=A0ABS9BZP0_9BACT|nr:restriction endonuclease subunit S [Mariniradius sediminis]MCF1752348.1 restriction endonuclease subunit S [Mariniradius sediminis]
MSVEKLPKGWRKLTISKIGKVVTGNTPSKSNPEFFNGNIPWVKPGDVKKSRIVFQTEETLTELGAEKARLIPPGSVIVTCIGDLGNITVAGKELATNQQINSIVVDEKIADFKYIYYWSLTLKGWLIENSTSTTISMVNKSKFENAPVILPPLPEQQRIVAKLDAVFGHLDRVQEKLDRIPELLKNFRQQVLTQAVTGELTREWRKGKDFGEWEETTIGELFEVKTGGTPRRGVKEYYDGGTIPWVKSGLVKNELIFEADEFITDLAINDSNVKIFPIDTLLVAMYGEGKTRGQVGWLKIEATTNQAIAALVNETMPIHTRTYVFYYCLSQYNDIRAKAEGGNQPNLNLSKIKEWEISVPPEAEQKEIVSRVDSLFNIADKIESQYQSLKAKIDQMPQAILAKAFRGELVRQEVKEYVREIGELGMVAEGMEDYGKE